MSMPIHSVRRYPPDHLSLDRSPNIGPLISRWELDKFKNSGNKSFRTSKILTLLYQQFSNLLILLVPQRDMSGPRLGALSNNTKSSILVVLSGSIVASLISIVLCQVVAPARPDHAAVVVSADAGGGEDHPDDRPAHGQAAREGH